MAQANPAIQKIAGFFVGAIGDSLVPVPVMMWSAHSRPMIPEALPSISNQICRRVDGQTAFHPTAQDQRTAFSS